MTGQSVVPFVQIESFLVSFFSGGAENLFDNIKSRKLELDSGEIRKWIATAKCKSRIADFLFLVFIRTRNNKTFSGLDQREHFTWTSRTIPARWYGVSRRFVLNAPHVQWYVLIQPRTNCRRPGILVLVNETDWELLVSSARPLEKCVYRFMNYYLLQGELDYEIQQNDNILFISTLHGG